MSDDQYTITKRDPSKVYFEPSNLTVSIQKETGIIIGEEAMKVMSDCVKYGIGYFKIGADGELVAVSAADVEKNDV